MADIAILVAEEYERRVKMSRKSGEGIESLSCVGVLGQNLKGSSPSWIKEKLAVMKEEKMVEILGKGGLDPKSQMSAAASTGFFSA